jgi:hypothetical protein
MAERAEAAMRAIPGPIIVLTAMAICVQPALAQSCRDEAGKAQAQSYVDQCLEVSPATHPPCNADNDCQVIIDEIIRGCDMLKGDAPGFCADYAD